MERTGLWDIKGSEGYIESAFKNQSNEGISGSKAKIGFGRTLKKNNNNKKKKPSAVVST